MGLFFTQNAKDDENRLKQVLIADKHFNPERIKEVIKSDVYHVLKNYTNLNGEDVFVDIDINSSGFYHIKIDATANNIKIFGALPDE